LKYVRGVRDTGVERNKIAYYCNIYSDIVEL